MVEDLESTNKSQIGSLEEPVTMEPSKSYSLEHGDIVIFGTVVCIFLWPGSAAGLARTAAKNGATQRPATGASELGGTSSAEVLSQLDSLMQGMTHLYSVVHGEAPGRSTLGGSRYRGEHYRGAATERDLFLTTGSAAGFDGDATATGLPGSPPRWGSSTTHSTIAPAGDIQQGQSPARLHTSVTGSRRVGGSTDRIGTNLQGAGDSSAHRRPDTAGDMPLPGLRRSAATAALPPSASGRDFEHLYGGISREGTARLRTAPSSRPGTMRSMGREPLPDEDVPFGRFVLPESCLLNILSHLPRLPGLLRMAGVSPYFRRLTQDDALWEELDLSWDTLAPNPICLRMTDAILIDLLQRMYRRMLRRVHFAGAAFVTDWTLLAISRFCFHVTDLSLRRHSDIGPDISDAGVVEIARRVPKLQRLDLACCSTLTNSSIATLAEHCPQLADLDLTGCDRVTDLAVMAIANSLCGAKMQRLLLQSCQLLTGESVQEVSYRCTPWPRFLWCAAGELG